MKERLNPRWVAQLMGVPPDWVYPSEQERNRTDELRMLGNGCVPQTVAKAFTTLLADLCRKVIDSGTKQ
jgi:site-specific DNA-cytosine methylase